VPTKYDAAIYKKKPSIGLSLPILFMPAFSVEKQYQMTHSMNIHIRIPYAFPYNTFNLWRILLRAKN
jgi:hypothetical protein